MSPRLSKLCLGAILVVVVFITYAPSVGNDFVDWDDLAFVVKNQEIREISPESIKWMFTTGYQGAWHPLTWFSHAIDRALFGLNPSPHHLISILLHIINTALFFILAIRLQEAWEKSDHTGYSVNDTEKLGAAFFGALLFALHPLRVESVTWVSERKDVLFSCFYLLGLLSYLGYAISGQGQARIKYLLALIFMALSVMSKSMAITFPFVLIILDYYPLKRDKTASIKALIYEKIPFFLVSLFGILVYQVVKGGAGSVPVSYVPIHMRIMNAFYSLIWYIKQTIFPGDLIPIYQLNRDLDYFSAVYIISACLVLAVTIICIWRAYKGDRIWSATWFFYLVTIFPALGLYMVFRHSMADRYTYLPTLGFWLLIGLGFQRLWIVSGNLRKPVVFRVALIVCVSILAVAYAAKTRAQIGVWKNSKTLWTHVIDKSDYVPALAYSALGKVFQKEDQPEKAMAYFNTASSLNPKNPKYYANMAGVYVDLKEYQRALELYTKASELQPRSPAYHTHIGRTLALMERYDQAEMSFKRALELKDTFSSAHLMLTFLYLETGRKKEALDHFRRYRELGYNLDEAVMSKLGITSEFKGH